MTYALCSDLHCHNWTLFSTLVQEDGDMVNSRLKTIMDEFDRACAEAKRNECERIYIAGDLFHVRGNLKTSVLNYVVYRMRRAARQNDIQVVIMPGNHDLEDREVTWLGNATMSLDDSGEGDVEDQLIRVISHPTFIEEDMVALVPWQSTRAGLMQSIEDISETIIEHYDTPLCDVDLVLHTGINGVLIGMPDHGWAPSELAEFGFKRVFAGHYHNHKKFLPEYLDREVPIYSIGALTHQTWSDVGTTAGFLIVDDNAVNQFESAAPLFMDFDPKIALADYAGHYVRIRGLSLDEADIKKLKGALEKRGAAGVVVHAVAKSKIVTRNGSSPSKSVRMEQSISDWIKASPIADESDVEREALDVLAEARGVI